MPRRFLPVAVRRKSLLDPEKAVHSEAPRIASALTKAAELWGLTPQELADIKQSLEGLS
jgi:hypothetical protein